MPELFYVAQWFALPQLPWPTKVVLDNLPAIWRRGRFGFSYHVEPLHFGEWTILRLGLVERRQWRARAYWM